ncbi:MAG: hypothetical protein AB1630_10880, partial [bacterium]
MKKLFLSLILVFGLRDGFSWGPITHYWLTQDSVSSGNEAMFINSMNPDLFWAGGGDDLPSIFRLYEKEWGNRAHSPLPAKITDPQGPKNSDFLDDKENFAYIMKLCTGYASDSYWRGFGAHIGGDWVAHNRDFLTIPEHYLEGSWPLKQYHTNVEYDMDYYLYLTRGKVAENVAQRIRINTNPELIWRALVNKRLIELKRNPPPDLTDKTDRGFKNRAISDVNSQCPIEDIISSIDTWGFLVHCRQFQCAIRRGSQAFLADWPGTGTGKIAKENYDISKTVISNWLNNPTPKEVPPIDVSPRPKDISGGNMDDDMKIWLEAIKTARDERILQRYFISNQNNNYEIEIYCSNETRLSQIFEETILAHKTNPTSDSDLVLAQVMEKVFLKPYITPDYNPPTIANLTPSQ